MKIKAPASILPQLEPVGTLPPGDLCVVPGLTSENKHQVPRVWMRLNQVSARCYVDKVIEAAGNPDLESLANEPLRHGTVVLVEMGTGELVTVKDDVGVLPLTQVDHLATAYQYHPLAARTEVKP